MFSMLQKTVVIIISENLEDHSMRLEIINDESLSFSIDVNRN